MHTWPFQTRRADSTDADAIAAAHRDSIQTIGPRFYPAHVVDDWQAGLTAGVYLQAMQRGEVFFIATESVGDVTVVLGFSSDYLIAGTTHGTSVYVRGGVARRGIGSRLLRMAEMHAVERGATGIRIEASLAAVEFYEANDYVAGDRGEIRLMSGRPIACVFMHKSLAPGADIPARSE
jgi:putative acetyltransferase